MVAIKTIGHRHVRAEIEAFERRFFREAKSAGRLNHPNIVTIYDVGKSGDVAYIAMEFLDGRSLREVLDSGVVLPHEKVADYRGARSPRAWRSRTRNRSCTATSSPPTSWCSHRRA